MIEVKVKEGIVEYFDGFNGIIKENNKETYSFLKKDLEINDLKIGDRVLFKPEVFELNPENKRNVARFVRAKGKK